jgi:hypothetical protein
MPRGPCAAPEDALKFVCVLSGGVVASFGLAALAARVRPITRIIGSRPPAAREVPSAISR